MSESKYDFKYRLDLDYEYIELLQKYIKQIEVREEDLILFNVMKDIVQNPKKIKHSIKKMIACDTATEARTVKAKEKIQNAINLLKMENKKLTYYSIAKSAGVSYVTVKKYITLDEMN